MGWHNVGQCLALWALGWVVSELMDWAYTHLPQGQMMRQAGRWRGLSIRGWRAAASQGRRGRVEEEARQGIQVPSD